MKKPLANKDVISFLNALILKIDERNNILLEIATKNKTKQLIELQTSDATSSITKTIQYITLFN